MNNEQELSPRFGGDSKKEEEEIVEKIQTFELNPKKDEKQSLLDRENKHKIQANFQLSVTYGLLT
jgi:hypothetical protein